MTRKLISVISPAWNESENLDELIRRLSELMQRQSQYDWEVIIAENGSVDDSWETLLQANKKDQRFKAVQLSRNFMADGGVMAAMRIASGDAVVVMNADLQDPPEMVDDFLELWEQGNHIVYGVIKSRQGEHWFKKSASRLFYRVANFLSSGVIPEDVTDFRLLDRRVAVAMNRLGENNRFTRGLSVWSGFKVATIPFVRPERFAGESKAPFLDLASEAFNGMLSFSYIPLRIASLLGFAFSALSILFLFWQLFATFMFGRTFEGYLTIVTSVLLLFGLVLFCLGIIGEYIAKIFEEVKQRPNFIISNTIGLHNVTDLERYDQRNALGRAARNVCQTSLD